MSTNPIKRTRSERVASLQIDSQWHHIWQRFTSRVALLRIGMALLVAIVITFALRGWNPPFSYRQGYIPPRAIVARVFFEMPDENKTAILRAQAAREVICYYENRRQQISQLRDAAKDQLLRLRGIDSSEKLTPTQAETLTQFIGDTLQVGETNVELQPELALASVQSILGDNAQIERLDVVLRSILAPVEERGLLRNLEHTIEEGNQRFIRVFATGQETETLEVEVNRVRIAEVSVTIREQLLREFRREFIKPESETLAMMVSNYILPRLPVTLTIRQDLTQQARIKKEQDVQPAKVTYFPSKTTMVMGGKPLRTEEINILRAEHSAWIAELSWVESAFRLTAFSGMLVALYLLCGLFFHFQIDRSLLTNTWNLARLLGLCGISILICGAASRDPWRAEVIPIVICAATATIAYGRNVTLVILSAIALTATLALGMDIASFVVLMAAGASTTLLLGRIRTRTRLINVTGAAAIVTALTTIGVGIMVGQITTAVNPVEAGTTIASLVGANPPRPWTEWTFINQLFKDAALNAGYTVLAGLIMYSILPMVERIFDVQTDLSLRDLGDPGHALLRQLAQRAPGTYNHSITVASIAEAAAESIGAHGLLVRVGAYFHDIGKMFKPTYFIENQSPGSNLHDSLQPAMSTLVIIAHVKDGANLARQHKLPKPIIDFIEQHHGTTLVEYFYRKEAKKTENQPDADEVDESTFRYPGPKPQTREAAVLMMADAVESASRTLVEPTPARLQSLIDSIAMKKLTDGQFDECGLTLTQLNTIKHSLLKSLTAIYHSRIKYTDQASA